MRDAQPIRQPVQHLAAIGRRIVDADVYLIRCVHLHEVGEGARAIVAVDSVREAMGSRMALGPASPDGVYQAGAAGAVYARETQDGGGMVALQ